MNLITVKYFKSWDEIKDIIIDKIPSFWKDNITSKEMLDRIQTYKVYFNPQKEPVRIKAFNKKGELEHRCFLKTKADDFKGERHITKSVHIYRQRNKTDVLKSGMYHYFFEHNEDGQFSKGTIYRGKEKYQTSYSNYDENGQLVEQIIEPSPAFLQSENFPGRYIYEYDEKGRKISDSCYDVDGSLENRRRYYYDEKDRIIKREFFSGDLYSESLIMCTLYDYKYSPDGNLVEEKRVDEEVEGRRERRIKYSYKKETNLLVEKLEYIDNEMKGRTVYTYDDKGRLLKEETCDSKGVVDLCFTYEYNENGQVIRQENFIRTPDGIPIETYIESEYDEKGRLKIERPIRAS